MLQSYPSKSNNFPSIGILKREQFDQIWNINFGTVNHYVLCKIQFSDQLGYEEKRLYYETYGRREGDNVL
jgi:hypothetical protein